MTAPTNVPVFKLSPTVQKYDWGKVGSQSKVAQLAQAGIPDTFQLDNNAKYAELWMGTHSTSPSYVHGSDVQLKQHLSTNHHLIGSKVRDSFKAQDGDVPFLFKVLSIAKALSIQTHPDKATAERLHAEQPHIYKDDNHKPEMAIALTPFTALCGFRPLPEIAGYLGSTPELSALVPNAIAARFTALASSSIPPGQEEKTALRDLFAAVMTAEDPVVKEQLAKLAERYRTSGAALGEEKDVVNLVLTLTEQFPGDIGIFCAFLLNYVKLQPGEAIFLGAGEPHAYVSGDIMECMATSDNVIRAGLTPKLRDIPNLVSGLTYVAGHHSKHVVNPIPFSTHSKLYDPPIPEFAVIQTQLGPAEKDKHRAVKGPSIAAVVEGAGALRWADGSLDVSMGDVVYLGADTVVSLDASSSGLTMFRAFVEV